MIPLFPQSQLEGAQFDIAVDQSFVVIVIQKPNHLNSKEASGLQGKRTMSFILLFEGFSQVLNYDQGNSLLFFFSGPV